MTARIGIAMVALASVGTATWLLARKNGEVPAGTSATEDSTSSATATTTSKPADSPFTGQWTYTTGTRAASCPGSPGQTVSLAGMTMRLTLTGSTLAIDRTCTLQVAADGATVRAEPADQSCMLKDTRFTFTRYELTLAPDGRLHMNALVQRQRLVAANPPACTNEDTGELQRKN